MKAGTIASDSREFTAYADLLDRAHGEGLKSITTELIAQPNPDNGRLCIVKAVVEVEKGHFEGIGDADPTSVEEFLAPHLIRVAETRAKARALRDAVNCGVVSFEEVDGVNPSRDSSPGSGAPSATTSPRHPRRSSTPPRGNGRAPARGSSGDGPMTEAQRRYLFRILAGQGYQGKAAEDYLYAELGVDSLAQVTRARASDLIDQLLKASPSQGAARGATSHQR